MRKNLEQGDDYPQSGEMIISLQHTAPPVHNFNLMICSYSSTNFF